MFYKKALKTPPDVRFTQNYHAMAWLGLGRIALRENKKSVAKDNFKMTLKLSEYKSVNNEAQKYLKGL